MTYTQQGEHVTLDMTRDDYDRLLVILGCAIGSVGHNRGRMWTWVAFVNDLNATNPNFTPYRIPEEYKHA